MPGGCSLKISRPWGLLGRGVLENAKPHITVSAAGAVGIDVTAWWQQAAVLVTFFLTAAIARCLTFDTALADHTDTQFSRIAFCVDPARCGRFLWLARAPVTDLVRGTFCVHAAVRSRSTDVVITEFLRTAVRVILARRARYARSVGTLLGCCAS